MVVLRGEDDHARPLRRLRQPPLHLEPFGNGSELFAEVGKGLIRQINIEIFGIELHPHQEQTGLFVGMFVGVQDVSVVAINEVGDGCDFALAVRAGDQEDGRVLHCGRPTVAQARRSKPWVY
jgi:hypothetical protein